MFDLELEIRRLAAESRTRVLCVGDRWYLGHRRSMGLTAEQAYVRLHQRWMWRRYKVYVSEQRLLANLRATRQPQI